MINRVDKDKNYTVIDNQYLFDDRLSWKAKGILTMMLSRPDDWIFHNDEMIAHSTDGEKSFRAGFKELQEHGYIKRFPIYENKKVVRWETVVNEVSETLEPPVLAQKLQVGKVQVQNLQVGNATLLSTDNNQVLNKPNTDNTNAAAPLFINITKCINEQLWETLTMKQKLRLQTYVNQIEDPAVIYECINITEQETPDDSMKYLFFLLDKASANRFTLDDVKRDHQQFKQQNRSRYNVY